MTRQDLMAALKNKDFESVPEIAGRLGEQARLDLEAAPDAATRTEIYRDFTAFINDALHLARVLRCHISTEYCANSASFLYAQSNLEQHHWQIKA